ncbi:unnamed protein product, partial [Nippostrongylus brasiliensis]|uniref:Uncharacterized protein n=1 Tax=Nippostrongylus brasiliensis TaxID=27835 RepID=A0A0N4YUR3_NIPBR
MRLTLIRFAVHSPIHGVMSACECLTPPPIFQLPPPPDLSLVWHLISDQPYEAPTDCEWSPFISISDVSSKIPLAPLSSRSLIVISAIALLILVALTTLLMCRIKRLVQLASRLFFKSTFMAALVVEFVGTRSLVVQALRQRKR